MSASNEIKPCEHILALWKYCEENEVYFEGCDCSGNVGCRKCNIERGNYQP